MNRVFRFLPLFLLLARAEGATPIFPLKEIHAGLKGEGKTVFSGTKIEAFQFEVIGVAKDFAGPGRDVIWCKMTADPTGHNVVAHGMSGSPCYIDGKLMGALAFGFTFSRDPIFGVQPIESMLEVLRFKGNEPESGGWKSLISGMKETSLPDKALSHHSLFPGNTPLLKTLAGFSRPLSPLSGSGGAQMLSLPIEIAGLHPLVADRINRALTEAGYLPLAGGGGGNSKEADKAEFEPGAPLTGVIMRGDLTMAVTGTLTWREGDRVLAFGHPFLNVGAVNIPMGKAEIVGTFPILSESFKMANKGAVLGALTQDRMSAVGGTVGLKPQFTPMSIKIQRPGLNREYKVEFCDNKYFTPLAYQTALSQFLANVMENTEEATLHLRTEIDFEDGLPPLRLEDDYSGEHFEWVMNSIFSASLQILPLYQNEFGTPKIRQIRAEAEIQPVVNSATLKEISVDRLEIHPGETIRVRAGFQPWHGKRFNREFSIPLPEEMKGGEVTLTLADARTADQIEGNSSSPLFLMLEGGTLGEEGLSSGSGLHNLKQLIEKLNDRHRNDRLYLFLRKKSEGLRVQNQRLTDLPPSVQNLLENDQSEKSAEALHETILSRNIVDFGSVIQGTSTATLHIKGFHE